MTNAKRKGIIHFPVVQFTFVDVSFFFVHFRAELLVDEAGEEAKLRLNSIKTSDEGEYKCEITFLDITKNCPVVQLVKLTTLGKKLSLKTHEVAVLSCGRTLPLFQGTWCNYDDLNNPM